MGVEVLGVLYRLCFIWEYFSMEIVLGKLEKRLRKIYFESRGVLMNLLV